MGGRNKAKGRDDNEMEILKRELAKARSKGDFKEVSNIHNRIGIMYREMSLFEEALEEHEEEANLTKKYFPNDVIGYALALRAKGEVYIDMKEEEQALPLVKEYLRLSLSVENLVEEQRAHVTLGRVYLSLALRFVEEGLEEEKQKSLRKAEKEFLLAKDLASNPAKMRISDAESVEMRCGVYINLFLVLDCAGREGDSLNFLRKAVELAESYALHDLLFRAHLSFYEVYFRNKQFEEAVHSAHAAANTAKALRDPKLQAEAGLLEAKANFLKNHVESGVSLLKRIRKDKKKLAFVEEELKALLVAGVRIIRTEDKLHKCSSRREKIKLYEILGDKFVEIGNFLQATVNYELALKTLEEIPIGNDKKKAALLFSLAETLNDMGKFTDAKKVYISELRLHENHNPSEAFKTQARLCSLLEKGDFPEEEILEAHRSALNFAKDCGSPAKELEALDNYAAFLKSKNRQLELEKILREIESLKQENPFIEEENSEKMDADGENQSDSGSSIDLNRLTSDDAESDDPEESVPRAITIAKKKFRLNEKGETPLHVAAKKGDLKAVSRLLRQGHEVNPRDSAGWIPLHEAANFGHVAVVKELITNGARINDQPSGPNCDKITPLHDAAANAHIDVVELLVEHGANVILKDANGNYPIDSLLICFQRSKDDLRDDEKEKFKQTLSLLKSKMANKGKIYSKDHEKRAKRKAKEGDDEGRSQPSFSVQIDKGDKVPITAIVDDFDPDDGDDAVDLYSKTMKGLRGKKKEDQFAEPSGSDRRTSRGKKNVTALIAEQSYVDDDWLDDDLGLRGRTNKRKRDARSQEPEVIPRRKESRCQNDDDDDDDVSVLSECNGTRRSSRNRTSKVRFPMKKNTSRIHLVSSDSDEDNNMAASVRRRDRVRSESDVDENHSDSNLSLATRSSARRDESAPYDDILDVDLSSFLDDEDRDPEVTVVASTSSSSRSRPAVRDIITSGDSTARSSFPSASSSSRLHPADREAIPTSAAIASTPSLSGMVSFCRSDARIKDVKALCNTLQSQYNLKEINLSGAMLFDEGVKALKSVLPNLKSLETLDLSLNGLTRAGLNHLREGYNAKTNQINHITSLNLNFNPLGKEAGQSLTELLARFLNLKKLFLADVDLSPSAFEDATLPTLLANLQLEELDLRYNNIGETEKQVLLDSGVFNQMKIWNKKNFDPQFPFRI